MDKYKIDSHKLIYHIPRVNDWLAGKIIYPIYMEVSPTGMCNHRCSFCGLDFMNYQKRFLDTEIFKERLSELGGLGLKSIMYSGEGEPFLHKEISDIILHTKKSGIDVAITTNGVFMNEGISEMILGSVEWIKVSFNGGTKETYSSIHHAKSADFDKVISNLSKAVKIKMDNAYKCVLGMQLLLLPENQDEVLMLASVARDTGIDYLVIKPYSQHPQSKTVQYKEVKYKNFTHLAEELEKISTEKFNVVFRANTMGKWDEKDRRYSRCLGLPFWSYIDAGGSVWGCSVYLEDKRFYYGNIYENSFQEIWEGEKRRESLQWVERELDPKKCRVNCRMDEVNQYLWDLRNLPEHINFI